MKINIKPIKSQNQYKQYLAWVDLQFDKKVKRNTLAGDQLEIVLLIIKKYEDENFCNF